MVSMAATDTPPAESMASVRRIVAELCRHTTGLLSRVRKPYNQCRSVTYQQLEKTQNCWV